jgi:16S rRNA (guanine527-N7)-methyltransferase
VIELSAEESGADDAVGVSPGVLDALAQARAFGYLGPGPLQTHIDHAQGFGACVEDAFAQLHDPLSPGRPILAVDLGSGGGVPGLILAERWPQSNWVFVDSHQRRMATLQDVLRSLQWTDRTVVVTDRAESVARQPERRGAHDLVVARGFAGPAVTAECAAGFLRVGGILVVSEPPTGDDRWSDAALDLLGMRRVVVPRRPFHFFVAVQERRCPPKYPRSVGTPGKSPLF